jgi:hypothetical protein
VNPLPTNYWLILGGYLSAAAAMVHIAIIIGGPDWYRFFGAGEKFASEVARGDWAPVIITFGIAVVLAVWAAYAFSGAGLIMRLPLLRVGLVTISAIYLVRAFALIPIAIFKPDMMNAFAIWSSAIVLIYGLAYAIGTWRAWATLPSI